MSSKFQLEQHLTKLEAFLHSSAHKSFVDGTKAQVDALADAVLESDIANVSDIINLIEMRAQRKLLVSNLTLFEEARVILKNRIAEVHDEEIENTTTKK